jgi:hypothetical protein
MTCSYHKAEIGITVLLLCILAAAFVGILGHATFRSIYAGRFGRSLAYR